MRHLSDTVGGVNLIFVGRLETDSSKGTFYVSGVGLPSALSCKDPELNIKKTITGLFFVFRVRKFGVIFR